MYGPHFLRLFYSFWLDCSFILFYLDDNLYLIVLIFNWSILESNMSLKLLMMLSCSSGSLCSMWVIFSITSIFNTDVCNLPLNSYSSVIQSSEYFVTSSIFIFPHLLHSIGSDATAIFEMSCLISPMDTKCSHLVSL